MNDVLKNSILTRLELYDKDNGIRVGALVMSVPQINESLHK